MCVDVLRDRIMQNLIYRFSQGGKTEANENKKKAIGLMIKKQLCTCITFLYISLPFVLLDFNVKLSETSQLHVLNVVGVPVCLFFTAAHFHYGDY